MIHIGRAQAYCANGNMTGRTVGSSYTLTYDVENRLTGVSGGASATVGNSVAATYDGDGNRVKGVAGGVTTYYVGNYYEYVGGAVKKYYYHAGKRVAMYDGATLNWLLGEHLGSTTVTANSSGTRTGEIRYKAYGASRYTYGTTPPTYHFTGQREESTIGLYYYGARWYDPALGRFTQADTIVPSPGNPQALNRYSYCLGNPLKYTDPSGHFWHIAGGALVGGLVGAGIAYGSQVMPRLKSGQSLGEAMSLNGMDMGKIAAGFASGFVSGAIMAAAGPAIAAELATATSAQVATTGVLGASAGVIGGQAGAITEAMVNHESWQETGFGDPATMLSDAVAGAAGGLASGVINMKAAKYANPVDTFTSGMREIGFEYAGRGVLKPVVQAARTLQMPRLPTLSETLVGGIAGFSGLTSEFAQQLIENGVRPWAQKGTDAIPH